MPASPVAPMSQTSYQISKNIIAVSFYKASAATLISHLTHRFWEKVPINTQVTRGSLICLECAYKHHVIQTECGEYLEVIL